MAAIDHVHYNGVYWRDIDWSKEIHSLGKYCPQCGSDGAEGHQNGCDYHRMTIDDHPRTRDLVLYEIRQALIREGRLNET